MVVKAGGAAVLHQFPHAGEGGKADHVGIQIFPDFIQGGEPVEQFHILDLGQIPGKDLIKMMVGVHQTGVAPVMGAVDDRIGGLGQIGADGADEAVFAVNVNAAENAVGIVAGDEGVQIFQQQGGHGTTLLSLSSIGEKGRQVNCLPGSACRPCKNLPVCYTDYDLPGTFQP